MSTLELMLEKLQQSANHNAEDLPPALPVRPISKARLPPGKKSWPVKLQNNNSTRDGFVSLVTGFESPKKNDVKKANEKCFFGGDTNGCLIQKVKFAIFLFPVSKEVCFRNAIGNPIFFWKIDT